MRISLTAVAAALVLTVAGPAVAAEAAKPAKPRPDLKVTQVEVTGTTSLSVSVKLKNAGTRKAGSSTVSLAVSKDATASSDDTVVGSVRAPKVKPRKKASVTATVQVPASTTGTYYVIACADSTSKLKERKEGNNCRSSAAITVPTVTTVTVSGTATAGGSVTTATTAGVCTGTTCTVPSGAATVTLTPVAAAGNTFVGWSGASCSGTTDAQKRRVVTNATSTVACTATFAASRTITYDAAGAPATITASTTAGSCTGASANAGTCTVPSGAATVTLTAGPPPSGLAFNGWYGTNPVCNTTAYTLTITNPAADLTCQANYGAI